MADLKITELIELSIPADVDLLAIVDDPAGTPITKKITRGNLFDAAAVFNESGNDADFRFEGVNDANLLFLNADTDKVGIGESSPDEKLDVVGNFQIKDAGTQTKAYRFRTTGGALDFEAAGSQWFISNWSGADFSGTQRFYLVFENGADIAQAVNTWQWRSAPNGTTRHIISGRGDATVFNEASEDIDFRIESLNYDALFIDAGNDSIDIMHNVLGKIGFYAATPITQAVLATGTGASVDDVITALQNLGLVKQS